MTTTLDVITARDGIIRQIQDRGYIVHVSNWIRPASGRTDDDERTVTIVPGLDSLHQLDTLAHELGHIVNGHGERSTFEPVAEIEAELTSAKVLAAIGIKDPDADSYIRSWFTAILTSGTDDPELLRHDLGQVETNTNKAAATILKGLNA